MYLTPSPYSISGGSERRRQQEQLAGLRRAVNITGTLLFGSVPLAAVLYAAALRWLSGRSPRKVYLLATTGPGECVGWVQGRGLVFCLRCVGQINWEPVVGNFRKLSLWMLGFVSRGRLSRPRPTRI